MADGNQNLSEKISREFIAYHDEEHGLGHKVAQGVRTSHERTSPRRTSHQTLSTLIGKQASKAVVPLHNDLGGYDKKTLEALIDFAGYKIDSAETADDKYVLAVPMSQVMELGESNFPSAFKNRPHAIGNLPNGEGARAMLRARVGRIFTTADAIDRCGAAIDGWESQGMEIVRLPENTNPYRAVLEEANKSLDPNRLVTTSYNDQSGKLERASRLTGQNYSKSLDAVLLPSDSVYLGLGKEISDHENAEAFDYVVVDNRLEGNMAIETTFLVLSRPEPPKGAQKRVKIQRNFEKWSGAVDKSFAKPGSKDTSPSLQNLSDPSKNPYRYSRALIKINSRGEEVKDTGLFTRKLTDRGLPYTPVVLNDRQETLPVVYDIQIRNDEESKRAFKSFLRDIEHECDAWKVQFLGAYGTDRAMPGSDTAKASSDSFWQSVQKFSIPVLVILLVGMALWMAFMRPEQTLLAKLPKSDAPAPAVEAGFQPNLPRQDPLEIAEVSTGLPAICDDDRATYASVAAPAVARFEIIRSAPENYWVCANTDRVTGNYAEALCEGATAPAVYADQAITAVSMRAFAEEFVRNDSVRDRLCNASVLIVTGSASSSPYERNELLPADRANRWAYQLNRALRDSCLMAPEIMPLSLGVAGCGHQSIDGQCTAEMDNPVDRQVLIMAAYPVDARGPALSRDVVSAELSSWLGSLHTDIGSGSLISRIADPAVFDLTEVVWADQNTAAHISVASVAPHQAAALSACQ